MVHGANQTVMATSPQTSFSAINPSYTFKDLNSPNWEFCNLWSEHTHLSRNALLLFAKTRPDLTCEQVESNPSPIYRQDSDGPSGRPRAPRHAPIPVRSAHHYRGDDMLTDAQRASAGSQGRVGTQLSPAPCPGGSEQQRL